jgi:DNA-binding CsgD family transcriptional regulator/PAS domain-containing protein
MPLAAYSKTVAAVFEAVLDERLTDRALQAVAEYVGAAAAAYVLVNKFTRQVSTGVWWGNFTGGPANYLAHYGKIDPFRGLQEKAEPGTLNRLSECLPQSTLSRDEWYNDWLLKSGLDDLLSTKLHESPSHMVIIGFHRAVNDAHPVPRDIDALRALMTPLQSAARLHVGLTDIGYRSAIPRGQLDHLTAGAIFTDGEGRIVETNQSGERILRIGDGLTMRNGQICARRNFETTKLAYLIAKAVTASEHGPSAGSMLIGRDGGRCPYVVRVAPVGAGIAGYDDLPMALVVVSVPDENRVSEVELAELYGLSPAESRIAIALAQGKRLTALAAELGLQITTLRTQLSSILRKCAVERQSDLVRLVLSIPVVHPLPSETERV